MVHSSKTKAPLPVSQKTSNQAPIASLIKSAPPAKLRLATD